MKSKSIDSDLPPLGQNPSIRETKLVCEGHRVTRRVRVPLFSFFFYSMSIAPVVWLRAVTCYTRTENMRTFTIHNIFTCQRAFSVVLSMGTPRHNEWASPFLVHPNDSHEQLGDGEHLPNTLR